MDGFEETIAGLLRNGYHENNVEEKLAQDLVLKALNESGLRRHITIKGGVVMAHLTHDLRRTTMDMDIDLIRYPLSDDAIDALVAKLNCLEGISIFRVGPIEELHHQEYRGKRIQLALQDPEGRSLQYKLDIGVHTVSAARQREMDFDLSGLKEDKARLLANGPEQIFVEKLKSLLRFGTLSSRGKDIFDMVYLADHVNTERLLALLDIYVYQDSNMRESSLDDILQRLSAIFNDNGFLSRLNTRRNNWMELPPDKATRKLLTFLQTIPHRRA